MESDYIGNKWNEHKRRLKQVLDRVRLEQVGDQMRMKEVGYYMRLKHLVSDEVETSRRPDEVNRTANEMRPGDETEIGLNH